MKIVAEIVLLIIYSLLGAVNFRSMLVGFINGSYFCCGLSFMALITVVTFMVKSINTF